MKIKLFARAEQILYVFIQVMLVLALAATFDYSKTIGYVGRSYPYDILLPHSAKIPDALFRYNWAQIRELSYYPPPADSLQLGTWCDSIEAHLGYPVAIFLKSDADIRFIRIPEHLQPYADGLPVIFSPQTPAKLRARADTVGNMLIWHGEVTVGKTGAGMVCFAPRGQKWSTGILRQGDDMLRAFTPNLFSIKSVLDAKPYAQQFAMNNGPRIRLRIMDGERMVGKLTDTDTTNEKWCDTLGAFRFEYYLSAEDQFIAERLRSPFLKYLMVFYVMLMAVLFFFHRSFKQYCSNQQDSESGVSHE
jgi:hypothetical protein